MYQVCADARGLQKDSTRFPITAVTGDCELPLGLRTEPESSVREIEFLAAEPSIKLLLWLFE